MYFFPSFLRMCIFPFFLVFSPGGVFGGTLGGLQCVLGALLCLQGPQEPPQGVPPGASGSLWNPLGVSRGASGRAPKRIQKADLRAPSFSWFLFTTFVLTCLKRNMSGSQPASTAIQPASQPAITQPAGHPDRECLIGANPKEGGRRRVAVRRLQ